MIICANIQITTKYKQNCILISIYKLKPKIMKTIILIFAMFLGVAAINAQTRTAIKVADLPQSITSDLATKHADWKATEAYSVATNNVMSYEVVVEKGMNKMTRFQKRIMSSSVKPCKTTTKHLNIQ